MNTDSPLDGFRSIKVKLAILVGLSVVAAAVISEAGDRAAVPAWLTVPVTVAAALGVTQWLSRGMTSPLRDMTAAASAMATGDYSRRVTTTSRDEVGELARAFNTMAADLAASDHQRRQLVATVSHELRTPLTAQRALLENLADGIVKPDSAALHTALAQAERLSELVADLLDLSRIDGGIATLDYATVQVRDVVEQSVAEARAAADLRAVCIESTVEQNLSVEVDAGRIAQVLSNLLDNAIRHSADGGRVDVAARRLDDDRWAIEVRDRGPGIPLDRTDKVFDRFGTWDESGGGTGLGLAIASWVCELHGGSIAVLPPDPEVPGARVRAVLPNHPGRPVPKEPIMTTVPPPAPPAPPPAPVQPTQEPFMDALFGRMWPEHGITTRTDLLLASGGIGLVAALILPYHNLGLGVLVVLLLCGGLVLHASLRKRAPWTILLTVVAVALSSLVVLRSAEWLTVLAVFITGLLVTSALTNARGLLSMFAAAASWVLAALRGLPLLGRSLGALSKVSIVWPIVRTVAISLVALVIFGGLFASGDAIFGSWAEALIPDLNVDGVVLRTFTGVFVAGMVLTACYVAINPPNVESLALPVGRRVTRPFEWLVPVGLVVAVFAAFVVAQATAMWGGHYYVQRTTGLTYAEYVHQGFGQLTAATFLALVTIAIASRKAPGDTPREQLTQRVVFGALCVLALVVVASAMFRMHVYQEAYGFTVLRLLVDVFEFWMGLLLVFVLVARMRMSGTWLPRAALLSAAVLALGVGLANPEAWVAQHNIDRFHESGKLDAYYLSSLGDDATPTIMSGLAQDLAHCIVRGQSREHDDLLEWNLSRARAADSLDGITGTPGNCVDVMAGVGN